MNVEAKVHVNGLYTHPFPFERGVKQGDPMSPILFALSFQSPKSLLEDKCLKGELTGLKISNENLLYQLFVDDEGLFLQNNQADFEKARSVIQVYENISGAFLNMAKLVIVPLVNP